MKKLLMSLGLLGAMALPAVTEAKEIRTADGQVATYQAARYDHRYEGRGYYRGGRNDYARRRARRMRERRAHERREWRRHHNGYYR